MSSTVDAAATAAGPTTGVAAALASAGGDHAVVRHADLPEPVHSPDDVARQLRIPVARITKTLLVTDHADPPRFALVVLPVTSRVETVALAAVLGWDQAAVAPARHLAEQVGQPVYAVSPFGAALPVVVDASVDGGAPVLVGSGTTGVEIELQPQVLVTATDAVVAPVSTGPPAPLSTGSAGGARDESGG